MLITWKKYLQSCCGTDKIEMLLIGDTQLVTIHYESVSKCSFHWLQSIEWILQWTTDLTRSLLFTAAYFCSLEFSIFKQAWICLQDKQIFVAFLFHLNKVRVIKFQPVWSPWTATFSDTIWNFLRILSWIFPQARSVFESPPNSMSPREADDILIRSTCTITFIGYEWELYLAQQASCLVESYGVH